MPPQWQLWCRSYGWRSCLGCPQMPGSAEASLWAKHMKEAAHSGTETRDLGHHPCEWDMTSPSADWVPAKANVDKGSFPKLISFRTLDLQMHAQGRRLATTAMSWTPKWHEGEKLARLGTVNSEVQRKPKYPRKQAAQNMRWSGRRRFRDCQITNIKSSVIGKRDEDEESWECLIPSTTLWRRRQLVRGSGNPCSMWSALTPDK